MTPLTGKARAATFCLDQLLAARRRGVRVCLICGSMDTGWREPTCSECLSGTGPMLLDPDDIIVMTIGPDQ